MHSLVFVSKDMEIGNEIGQKIRVCFAYNHFGDSLSCSGFICTTLRKGTMSYIVALRLARLCW